MIKIRGFVGVAMVTLFSTGVELAASHDAPLLRHIVESHEQQSHRKVKAYQRHLNKMSAYLGSWWAVDRSLRIPQVLALPKMRLTQAVSAFLLEEMLEQESQLWEAQVASASQISEKSTSQDSSSLPGKVSEADPYATQLEAASAAVAEGEWQPSEWVKALSGGCELVPWVLTLGPIDLCWPLEKQLLAGKIPKGEVSQASFKTSDNCLVYATGEATVARCWHQEGLGGMIILEHPQGWRTLMAGIQHFYVKAGDAVVAGTVVGRMPKQEATLRLEAYSVGKQDDR